MKKINPRVDFAFKKLFGSEENKSLLIGLINSIVFEKDHVTDIRLENPYNPKNFNTDKLSILDIKAKDSCGTWYNIEMQIIDNEYFTARALYYWAKVYSGQLLEGSTYTSLKKTISINILNFNCLTEAHYHNVYQPLNVKTFLKLSDHQEIHFVELKKFEDGVYSTLLDRWVTFLKNAEKIETNKIPHYLMEVPEIVKAIECLENMSFDNVERDIYESHLKFLLDEDAGLKTAENRGLTRGIEIGVEKGRYAEKLDLARTMKQQGLSMDIIKNITGLSESEF